MAEKRLNIWDFAQATRKERMLTREKPATLLFVGNKKSGKSAVMSRLTGVMDGNHAAVALEYTFARDSGSKTSKSVCDMWELGGGTLFCNLLDCVITAENLANLAVVLCVDLSLPNEMIATMETLVDNMRERLETILSRESNYLVKESLRQKSRQRIGESHEDAADLTPFLVPLLILGTKYDLFQGLESEKKKVICRYMRLASHTKGAALYFTTTKSEVTMKRIKSVLSQLSFGSQESVISVLDVNKAVSIPFGCDSFQLIGHLSLDSARAQVMEMFPNQEVSPFVIPDNPAKDAKFAEKDIDLVRAVREKELEEYRRQVELKMEIGEQQ